MQQPIKPNKTRPNGADVLKFFDIKGKYMKARYYWRFSHCSYRKLADHVEISEETAKRWVKIFNIDNNKKGNK